MSNPFKDLKKPKKEELDFEEWGGQFSCQKYIDGKPCNGWSNVAKYFPKEKLLAWQCQDGHRSFIEDVVE